MNLTSNSLTVREEEVYRYLLQGLNYGEIADRMTVEKSTAVTHIMNVYMKKLVGTRAELMAQRIKELEKEVEDLRRTNCITRAKQNDNCTC